MANVIKRKDSEHYYAVFYDRTGKRQFRTTKTTDKKAAQSLATQWEREAMDGTYTTKKTTLKDAIDLHMVTLREAVAAGKRSTSTISFYETKTKPLTEHFGAGFPLANLTNATPVTHYITSRRESDVTDHTIAKELVALRTALKLCKERGLWHGDIAAVIPTLSTDYKPRDRALTQPEVDALVAALEPEYLGPVAFCIATGARWSECMKACREDVAETIVNLKGTKTDDSHRTIPVVLPACQKLLTLAMDNAAEKGPLFLPWPSPANVLNRACDKAKIPQVTPNDLRRTFATWHVNAGVELGIVAKLLGHADTTMVYRVYGKPTAGDLAERITSALASPKAPKLSLAV